MSGCPKDQEWARGQSWSHFFEGSQRQGLGFKVLEVVARMAGALCCL